MFEQQREAAVVDPVVLALRHVLQLAGEVQTEGLLADAADVVELLRLAEAAQAVALRAVAAFDRAGGHTVAHPELHTHPHATAAAFLQQTVGLSGDDARGRVTLARRLAPSGDLGPLGDVAVAGGTTLRHVRAVADGVRGLDPAVVAEAMPALVSLVQVTDPTTITRELRERAHAVSDALAAEQEKRQRERRGFWLSRSTDGVGHAKGTLPALEADVLEEALARVMQRERVALDATGSQDTRDNAQRRADALVTLARHALASDTVGQDGPLVGTGGVRAAVTVLVSAEQLVAVPGAAPARTTSSAQTVLSKASLLELTCDADLSRVTLDTSAPTGTLSSQLSSLAQALVAVFAASPTVLDAGRTTRTVTPAQWRALVARDCTCVIAGCSRPAAGCQAHHVQHWTRGGPSDLTNYALVCHQHHHEIHGDDTLWHRHRDGRWLTPDGYRPPDARPPDLRSTIEYPAPDPRPPGDELF